MVGKWFGKMKEMFFGDIVDFEGNDKNEKSKFSGRIIINQNDVEPKVIHRYPEGKFRFPLIPDDASLNDKQPLKEKRNIDHNPIPSKNNSNVNEKVPLNKEKFTGRNFKAREIPSPVYGFGERSLYQNKELVQLETNNNDVFEDVEKQQLLNPTSLHLENKEVTFYEEQQRYTNTPLLTDDNLVQDKENDILYSNELEIEQGINVTEAETFKFYEESTISSDNDLNLMQEEENEILHSEALEIEQDINVTEAEIFNPKEEYVSSRARLLDMETELSGTAKISEPSQSHDYPQHLNEQSQQKKYVPFNVLMLKEDKRNVSVEDRDNKYQFPPIHLLEKPSYSAETDAEWLLKQKELLQSTLQNFNVKAAVIGAIQGPAVTRLEVQPSPGVKVSKITNLSDDIKLSLSARDIRIEAPIPGRNAVGIEVPNLKSRPVPLREIIQTKEFKESSSPLTVALGLDISGQPVVTDLQKMPHGLIAGATGSGKSVCINSILISLFYKADPDEVKLLLIDPKMVELAPYNRIPHLVTPVITDAKEATNALKWTVDEMERRYEEFSLEGARDIKRYNDISGSRGKQKLPYIVVIIDELADLMMVAPHDVEEAICRIAQKARACGIHLLLATQRPSVDVITGLIKANIPTRAAFSVSSQVDSRTIIDSGGAEKLLGKGDMLFLGNGTSKPNRIQGTFVSDEEIERITAFIRKQKEPEYLFEKEVLIQQSAFGDFEDDLFSEACEFVLSQGAASSSALQRRFRIGFNRAARLVEMMESKGIVSEAMGSKPRNVLLSKEEYDEQVLDN